MANVETRAVARDSLFLLAEVELEGIDVRHRVKVRNLSPGGMMGEGGPRVVPGTHMTVHLRNVAPVQGTVAWVQDSRFGVAFADDVNPQAVRGSPHPHMHHDAPRYTRNIKTRADRPTGPVRKI
ncbi:MAG: PilZ domain-containing protein [Novosphingobium sp.]|nr:PilZ domain-containing protein [Novosphingobium sp.]